MWKVGRMVGLGSVLAIVLALVPAEAFAQKKKKDAKDDSSKYPVAADEDYAKLKKDVLGSIASFDSGGKSLTVRVSTSHQEPNPNYKAPGSNPKSPNNNAAVQQLNLTRKYQDLQTQMQKAAT